MAMLPEKGKAPDDFALPMTPEFWNRLLSPTKDRLESSRQWWSKQYDRELTLDDAAEIHRNLFGLIKFLAECDVEQRRRKAGGHVPGEAKVRTLRYETRHLEKQMEATDKMAKHWRNAEPQRAALDQASEALRKQLTLKEQELRAEIDGPKKTVSVQPVKDRAE